MSAFDSVIGYQDNVTELLRLADIMKNKEYYHSLGAKLPHGALLVGNVGLGKTLCAECFLKEVGHKSYILRRDGDNFMKTITATFDEAIASQPSVVLCDDMDHWGKDEDDTEPFTVLQAAIDKAKDADVFVIATVNNEKELPRSLRRRGRFDITLKYEVPQGEEMEAIISHYLKDKNLADDVNFSDICKMVSGGMSCADADALMNYAAVLCGYERQDKISMKHFVTAILQNNFNYYGENKNLDEDERKMTATHEAAHILVAEVLQPNSVGFASLLIREKCGVGVNGVTHFCNKIHRRCNMIMVELGGKVGVELKYPRIASGCYADLSEASKLLTKGISDNATLGYGFFDISGCNSAEPSQDYLRRMDAVVAAEFEKYSQLTRKIILSNIEFLDKLTDFLLEHNTILHSEIQAIKATCNIVDDVG